MKRHIALFILMMITANCYCQLQMQVSRLQDYMLPKDTAYIHTTKISVRNSGEECGLLYLYHVGEQKIPGTDRSGYDIPYPPVFVTEYGGSISPIAVSEWQPTPFVNWFKILNADETFDFYFLHYEEISEDLLKSAIRFRTGLCDFHAARLFGSTDSEIIVPLIDRTSESNLPENTAAPVAIKPNDSDKQGLGVWGYLLVIGIGLLLFCLMSKFIKLIRK